VKPYYADDLVTLYLGDCREVTEWLAADVVVADPPYGRKWKQGRHWDPRHTDDRHAGIKGDEDTAVRDAILAMWGPRLAIVFGDLTLAPPPGNKQTLVYRKPPNAGARGAMGGFRRDVEGIYLLGPWPSGLGGLSSVITTNAPSQGNPASCQGRYGHPHAKPVDVMETLIAACPGRTVADPSSGAGSTLIAARNLGRPAIGVELEERYCERAAKRLCQGVLIEGVLPGVAS
jgi:site-specific DNA-methyltransferase (adenine-specific)